MRERLDAGDHLDAEQVGVVVALADVGLGVAGAHIAEIRLRFHVEAVLAVEHQHRKPHLRKLAQQLLDLGHPDDRVALRNVEHRAVERKLRLFGQRKRRLAGAQMLHEQAERAEKVDLAVIDDGCAACTGTDFERRAVPLRHLHRKPRIVQADVEVCAKLPDAGQQLLRNTRKTKLHHVFPFRFRVTPRLLPNLPPAVSGCRSRG